MKKLFFLAPLIPYLWTTETTFSQDALLIVTLIVCLMAGLSKNKGRAGIYLWLLFAYINLFHAGVLRSGGFGASVGLWVGLLAGLAFTIMSLRARFPFILKTLEPPILGSFALLLPVLFAVGAGIRLWTEGPLSRTPASIIAILLVPVLALSAWPELLEGNGASRRWWILGLAFISLVGLGRGVVQGVLLYGAVRSGDALTANGQYQQAREEYNRAMAWAESKQFRPAIVHIRLQRFTVYRALQQPIQALREYRAAIALSPERLPEIVQGLDEAFIAEIASEPFNEENNTNLAVDVEISRDGADVYILDSFGRVYLAREGDYKRIYDANLRTNRHDLRAVDLELSDNGSGFAVLDSVGGIHLGGNPSSALKSILPEQFPQRYRAIDLELTADEKAAYILDRSGIVHAYGESHFVKEDLQKHFWPNNRARSLEIAGNGSLIIMDCEGATHWIGETNSLAQLSPVPYWPDRDVARDFEVWPDARSWAVLDLNGAVHYVGELEYNEEEAKRYYHTFASAVDMEIAQDTGGLVFVDGNFHVYRASGRSK